MSLVDDMIGRPTDGEKELRRKAADTLAHAEELEEKLMTTDPAEFTDHTVHVRICNERQVAAHVWRKANSLQGQLNGAENRRYSRSITIWMLIMGAANLLKDADPAAAFGKVLTIVLGHP